jgi:hypothetical protein
MLEMLQSRREHYMQGSGLQISSAGLQRLVGSGAYDSQGKGNINTGDGGIAFIVASAACVPGGVDLVRMTRFPLLSSESLSSSQPCLAFV